MKNKLFVVLMFVISLTIFAAQKTIASENKEFECGGCRDLNLNNVDKHPIGIIDKKRVSCGIVGDIHVYHMVLSDEHEYIIIGFTGGCDGNMPPNTSIIHASGCKKCKSLKDNQEYIQNILNENIRLTQ